MAKYIVNLNKRKSQINKNIYGNFSEHLGRCIYEGLFVGEDSEIPNKKGMRCDVVEALKKIKLPILRWPGGCFADEYHWKDGIGPKEERKTIINTHWGGVVEDNSFGTHDFMELCDQIGCEPYINGNVGSGTVQEMSEWMEYLTFNGTSPMAKLREENGRKEPWKVKYFGVGNESWGCGGNMRPEYYADLYRRYQTYVREYGDNKLFKIACGPNGGDGEWTEVLMKNAAKYMDGLSLHYYTTVGEWDDKGSATEMTKDSYYLTLKHTFRMETFLKKHEEIMDRYDPEKKVALFVDEWGTWYEVEPGTNPGFLYQQNTMRDALVAGINLNLFNKHCDRVRGANIAQLVNVLQAVILTEGEKMVLTPTYHVFDLYKEHQDATLVDSYLDYGFIKTQEGDIVDLHESASLSTDGKLIVTICNLDVDEEKTIDGEINGGKALNVQGEIVHEAMDAYNTFENPQAVVKKVFTNVNIEKSGFTAIIPPCSVVRLAFELE